MKEDVYPPLEADRFYHIYNRGNNRENIFYKQENYRYFLRKYDEYLGPFLETYAYCLLPNHFHLLVKVKDTDAVLSVARHSKFQKPQTPIDTIPPRDGIDVSGIISEQFRRFFISYSQAINKQQGRVGSLFQKNFKRKHIGNDAYFTGLVHYIHANPQLHGICGDYTVYEHSSYGRILLEKPTKLHKRKVLDWFGGKTRYEAFHTSNLPLIRTKRVHYRR